MASPHIGDGDLGLRALDRLPESAAAPAEKHLLICAEGRERLAGWDECVRALGTTPAYPMTGLSSRRLKS
jgi:hypothetical protein